ncbi:MAG: SDR family oxidoreductase [Deltaproteobacteria bacterium]|nr:SDR family oxidoreductase [Deltaproteobacteria bacterium]
MNLMNGKVVIVTGGARGIGKAVARLLAAHGAVVVATSRKARAFPSRTAVGGGGVLAAPLDVRDEKSVLRLFAWVDKSFGHVDVLVNNAGIGVFKPFEKVSEREARDVLDTNVLGALLCAREAFRRMKARGGGRIVNVGSVADHVPLPLNAVYAASKHALRGLTASLNEEGKAHGVRVTLVSPGATSTEIWEGRKGFSSKDMLLPEDVAESVLDVARRPLRVRIDEVRVLPPKGVL